MTKDDFTRNIQVIDWSDSSGDVIAVTSRATLLEDLLFLYDSKPGDDCPLVYDACVKLAGAYANGDDYSEPSDFLRIELRAIA